jgi:poly-gamma-glutamate synthesis protein (capsule biosynthesis protein)
MNKALRVVSLPTLLIVAGLLIVSSVGFGWSSPAPPAFGDLPAKPVMASAADAASLDLSLWISPAAPSALRQQAEHWGIRVVDSPADASSHLDLQSSGTSRSVWIYALVAPFPTVADGVTFKELLANWKGTALGPFAGQPLLMDEATLAAFSVMWGPPSPRFVRSVPADQLLNTAWNERPSWAIVPFESLEPRWKVLTVDGQSPIRKDFQVSRFILQTSFDYPLAATFSLVCSNPCPVSALPVLPASNRDPSKMTSVVMTGVTALVRATAYTMSVKGVTYPGRDIREWLTQADITHVSNEIPFFDRCPRPKPAQSKLVFCSDPGYIALLNYIGVDVVEMTGNHFADYGPPAMLQTLALYQQNHMSHYGGGADLQDARQPLLLERDGNRIAFIGCNSVDVGRAPTATANRPGAAPCDYEYMTEQIRQLHARGYLVIATFQYYETYVPKPFSAQMRDFRLMADAGATIVQGSQAHYPQTMEFRDGAFIHYGLGNLFFDQMGDPPFDPRIRREFMDRHVFYDGRYISTELLTAMLEDYSRPRPMTPEERAVFLADYFAWSGW